MAIWQYGFTLSGEIQELSFMAFINEIQDLFGEKKETIGEMENFGNFEIHTCALMKVGLQKYELYSRISLYDINDDFLQNLVTFIERWGLSILVGDNLISLTQLKDNIGVSLANKYIQNPQEFFEEIHENNSFNPKN